MAAEYEAQLWASLHFQRYGRGFLARVTAAVRSWAGGELRAWWRECGVRQGERAEWRAVAAARQKARRLWSMVLLVQRVLRGHRARQRVATARRKQQRVVARWEQLTTRLHAARALRKVPGAA